MTSKYHDFQFTNPLPDTSGFWEGMSNSDGTMQLFKVTVTEDDFKIRIAGSEHDDGQLIYHYHRFRYMGATIKELRDSFLARISTTTEAQDL